MFEISSKTYNWRRFGAFTVNFELILQIAVSTTVFILDFEQVNPGWVELFLYNSIFC